MFNIFKKNPTKKLRKQLDLLHQKAVHAQRNGKIEEYGHLSTQADKLYKEILKIEEDMKLKAENKNH